MYLALFVEGFQPPITNRIFFVPTIAVITNSPMIAISQQQSLVVCWTGVFCWEDICFLLEVNLTVSF
jgi:hypothetical protein